MKKFDKHSVIAINRIIKKKLKLSFWEIICFNICFSEKTKSRNNLNIFKKAKNEIKKKIDINFMLFKFNEIDKLKNLLLSEEQMELFNLIPDIKAKSLVL